MAIEPYLFFNGRCEEAIEFYKKALGAEVLMLMRYKESPEPPPPGMVPPGWENTLGWRSGADAAHEDLLVAALRHARRPLRRRLDGHSCALTQGRMEPGAIKSKPGLSAKTAYSIRLTLGVTHMQKNHPILVVR